MRNRIAITGGIGSGKSYVCSKLRQHGIEIYDCDAAAKRLIAGCGDLQRKLTELIGPDTFVDGKLNKTVVTRFLMASEDNTQAINSIVHPAVADDFLRSGCRWMECAILYESGFNRLVDYVIAVTAPVEVRLQRIQRRDGISCQKAREWIERQMSQEQVASRADYVIPNDGITDIDREINRLLTSLSIE